MPDSFVDRILVGHSLDGNGPLTRSLHETHTSGYIGRDAPHWSIEPYLPLSTETLVDYLLERGELAPEFQSPFRQCCSELNDIVFARTASYQSRFRTAYGAIDPDADQRLASQPAGKAARQAGDPPSSASRFPTADAADTAPAGETKPATSRSVVADAGPHGRDSQVADPCEGKIVAALSLLDEILSDAGFQRLESDEITRGVGVVSQFGVPLHIDLDIFQRLSVYARGDVMGSRIRRRWRTLYRREVVDVQVYQRLVVVFQLRDDDETDEHLIAAALHLRMFKNVPKQDVDTLLPGARVRITGIDRAKIIVPSLGGFLMSLRRIAQTALLFAVITLHWSAILAALLVGYLIKSVFSYFQTKNRYQLNLTRNLYFQKLDANAGAGYHVIQLAHQQLLAECILALYAILTSDEPLSTRRLRRKCERLIREAVSVEIDFQVDRPLEFLLQLGLVQRMGEDWYPDRDRMRSSRTGI